MDASGIWGCHDPPERAFASSDINAVDAGGERAVFEHVERLAIGGPLNGPVFDVYSRDGSWFAAFKWKEAHIAVGTGHENVLSVWRNGGYYVAITFRSQRFWRAPINRLDKPSIA